MKDTLPIPYPGETLREDFMEPMGLSAYRVAKDLGVQPIAISQILRGQRAISAEMALRLARYTGASASFWLGLQESHDLRQAQRKAGARIERLVKPHPQLQAA
ncbi:MAG: HigA family addiction module antitoxin [Methylacidiphilales bacterium]|nr:HigA family addiction module antitoxin [Candidatus Methylacidiphilales bacterium]